MHAPYSVYFIPILVGEGGKNYAGFPVFLIGQLIVN
jgi:hypothetical protein